MCALRGGSCAYINPSSALAGPACKGQADCARFQALNNAQDQARFLNILCGAAGGSRSSLAAEKDKPVP